MSDLLLSHGCPWQPLMSMTQLHTITQEWFFPYTSYILDDISSFPTKALFAACVQFSCKKTATDKAFPFFTLDKV